MFQGNKLFLLLQSWDSLTGDNVTVIVKCKDESHYKVVECLTKMCAEMKS